MLDITKVRAIGLDLDDTLWPIWPAIARAEQQLASWLEQQAPLAALVLADPQRRSALRDELARRRPDLSHDMSAMRRELIRMALACNDEDTGLAEPAFEVFFEHRMRVDLYADALPALQFLADRFPVVAISNGNADVHRVGIGRHFSASLSAHAFGVGKPDRRIFHAAAAAAGVDPDAVLHVGDDPELDVLGALDAGMQAVWVNRDDQAWTHERRPDASVAGLDQLCALLAAGSRR
jgi:FMN hydrolase / 5-amino-6-(5-phospho-D-ribitylamino)uracil phosphatase